MNEISRTENPAYVNPASKVPAVTLAFWIIKILATTLGETGGDALSMTFQLGYAISTLIFLGFFAATLTAQVMAKRFHPAIYWAVVVATTTLGTTTSDFFDRTLGFGYMWSSAILSVSVGLVLLAWRWTAGRIEFENIQTRRDEVFYWVTILISNTLGTALGDYVADDAGLGFERGAAVFGALLILIAIAYLFTKLPRSILFWSAYVLTRPLGATVGDLLTKPRNIGGLALGRIGSSVAIGGAMIVAILLTERRRAGSAS